MSLEPQHFGIFGYLKKHVTVLPSGTIVESVSDEGLGQREATVISCIGSIALMGLVGFSCYHVGKYMKELYHRCCRRPSSPKDDSPAREVQYNVGQEEIVAIETEVTRL